MERHKHVRGQCLIRLRSVPAFKIPEFRRGHMKDIIQEAKKAISGPKYREALKKTAEFKKKVNEANAFRLDSILSEAGAYFSSLKSEYPETFDVLRVQIKEISELAI